jgi:hypothetical protein
VFQKPPSLLKKSAPPAFAPSRTPRRAFAKAALPWPGPLRTRSQSLAPSFSTGWIVFCDSVGGTAAKVCTPAVSVQHPSMETLSRACRRPERLLQENLGVENDAARCLAISKAATAFSGVVHAHRAVVVAYGSTRCEESDERQMTTELTNIQRRLAEQAAAQPGRIASLLLPYACSRGWNAARLARAVGCPLDALPRLLVARNPFMNVNDADDARWRSEVANIARSWAGDPTRLEAILRIAEAFRRNETKSGRIARQGERRRGCRFGFDD